MLRCRRFSSRFPRLARDLACRTEVAQSRVKDSSIGASVEGEANSSAIRRWLNDLGLGQYGDVFEHNDLDIDVLRDLSELDLEKIGVSLGHRKKLIRAIAALGPPGTLRPARDHGSPYGTYLRRAWCVRAPNRGGE